jgi:hypothetical protein
VTHDARPFVAFFLRARADERLAVNGMALHSLARWVENLPSGNAAMHEIEATDALNCENGALRVGARALAIVDAYDEDSDAARDDFLIDFAAAIRTEAIR